VSLCNACGLRFQWMLKREKKVKPKVISKHSLEAILNDEDTEPTRIPRSVKLESKNSTQPQTDEIDDVS